MALHPQDAQELEQILAEHDGLGHLWVKGRGQSLTIHSGDVADPHAHARITRLGKQPWGLSLPRHTGRWERTPFVGTMAEVIDTVITDFSFHLEDLAPPGSTKPLQD